MFKNKIIFVDFDNTLTYKSQYPITGKLNRFVINHFKKLSNSNELILWTCRQGEELEQAVKLCNDCGLYFKGHNEYNGVKFIKPKFDILYDDKVIRVSFWFKIKCFIMKLINLN